MKKNILNTIAFFILAFMCLTGHAQRTSGGNANDNDDDFYVHNFHGKPGEWGAVIKNERIHIEFAGPHWNNGRQFSINEFTALPSGTPGTFKLQREAGTIVFEGVFTNNQGKGTFKFEENADFKSWLAAQGFANINNELMLQIFFTDINKAYFEYLKSNGYSGISREQLKDLAQQNISRKVLEEDFTLFAKQGYGKVSLEKIIQLREHGVDAAFVNSFVDAGYKSISLDEALRLRDHGVDMEFINGFGIKDMPLEKAVNLRDHGVDPDYVKGLTGLGWKEIDLETATGLRDHGVDVEFVKSFQAIGYKDISPEKARDLRDHGVSSEYLKELNDLGWKDLTLETAEELRNHGVSASFVKEFQESGYKDISSIKAMRLRDHGVTASYISGFKTLGFTDISLDKAQEMHDRGLTSAFVKKMQEKGLTKLSLEEYEKLRDAGM